jgi:1,4-dihydroxy-2-naphthoate octaprenyltransferase
VGISAHFLDAVGGKTKPWGMLPKKKITTIALISLGVVFTIGLYYGFLDSPLLIPIGIIEGFFLFAYNLELFGGKFHNNPSTIFSWGILPVFAGSAIQTNSITLEAIIFSAIAAMITYALIITSRKYKHLCQSNSDELLIRKKENLLKIITFGVIGITTALILVRLFF